MDVRQDFGGRPFNRDLDKIQFQKHAYLIPSQTNDLIEEGVIASGEGNVMGQYLMESFVSGILMGNFMFNVGRNLVIGFDFVPIISKIFK